MSDEVSRDWTRVKLLLGVAWIVACVLIYLHGGTAGFWLQIPLEASG